MKLNPKLTGGLAWAGLVVVLAVPSADLLTQPNAESATLITSDTDPTRTASVVVRSPAAATVPGAVDPVDQYLESGKKLPSYISDAPAEVAAAKPAPTVKLIVPESAASQESAPAEVATLEPVAEDEPAPVEVASLEPAATATPPQPYPASMRPAAPAMTTASVQSTPRVEEEPLIIEEPRTAEQPLIIDENMVARRDAAVARVLDDDYPIVDSVEGEFLEEWDSGSLADYLERRGLIAGGQEQAQTDYDPDGFFLDDGPNRDGPRLIRRLPPREFSLF